MKFEIMTLFGSKRRTHAVKAKNMSWCGVKFKEELVKDKKEGQLESVTCQKCLNTINANASLLVK